MSEQLANTRPTSCQGEHTHPCGHDCMCCEPVSALCDGCELAEVVIRRHALAGMTRQEALCRIALASVIFAETT